MSEYDTSDGDRTTRIREWLNRACGNPHYRLAVQVHLQDAFLAVLGGIPETDAQTFLAYDPTIVALEGCLAQVSCHYARRRWQHEDDRLRIPMIHFVIDMTRQMPDSVVFLVAHEIAHIVLGHLDDDEKSPGLREAEVALKVEQWGFSEPESFYTLDPGLRLRHLTTRLDEIIDALGGSWEDDTWAEVEGRAIPPLRRVVEGLRDLLRPPELSRLRAHFTLVPDLAHEPPTLRGRGAQDPPAPPVPPAPYVQPPWTCLRHHT